MLNSFFYFYDIYMIQIIGTRIQIIGVGPHEKNNPN